MGILKNIWNTILGKTTQDVKSKNVGKIVEAKMDVVHNKNAKKIGGYSSGDTTPDNSKTCHYLHTNNFCQPNFTPTNHGVCNVNYSSANTFRPETSEPLIPIPNGDDFFASKEILSKEEKTDSFKSEKKKISRNVIGQKTLSEIKDYLLTYGSIDVLTCEQKFKVKSLQNFIWHLRKDGLKIKTDKVSLHNELGQKVEITNYRLIAKK